MCKNNGEYRCLSYLEIFSWFRRNNRCNRDLTFGGNLATVGFNNKVCKIGCGLNKKIKQEKDYKMKKKTNI